MLRCFVSGSSRFKHRYHRDLGTEEEKEGEREEEEAFQGGEDPGLDLDYVRRHVVGVVTSHFGSLHLHFSSRKKTGIQGKRWPESTRISACKRQGVVTVDVVISHGHQATSMPTGMAPWG